MTNETKVGLLAVITIALSIFGYNFLKGVNVLSSPNLLYSTYQNVSGLTVSSPVVINGLQVGVVKDIYFQEDMQTIEVVMNIEQDFRIPKDAEAVITSTGLMGGTAIYLKYKSICNGPNCAQSGDRLKGRIASALEAYIGQPEELDPYFNKLKKNIGPVTDSIKMRLTNPNSDDAISKSIRDIAVVLDNLKQSTAQLSRMMVANAQPLNATLKNAQSLTGNLSENNPKIDGILANADTLTGNLAALQLEQTLEKTNDAMEGLKATMNSANTAVGQLNDLFSKINNGEGAIGRLLKDDEIVDDFSSLTVRLDSFLTDFQERPYRYLPLLSRNKVMKYDKKDGKEN